MRATVVDMKVYLTILLCLDSVLPNIYTFVIAYLQNIYTALFIFTCVNFVSLLGSLVMIRALQDQGRYEKSMLKMINLHNLDDLNLVECNEHPVESPYSDASQPHNQHTLPQNTNRSSVIYSAHKVY
ncbi:hypothetical protein L0F63_002356 [Massospora cicadina]|nr:hypothetical protein L0F63_002356 [Massospora cicadina]